MAVAGSSDGHVVREDLAVFSDDLLELSYAGASVIPFAVVGGDAYILLGKDRRVHRWADSEQWSDFGGKVRAGEVPFETAARELWEETCAQLFDDAAALARALEGGDYAAQLRYRMHGRVYICFLKEVPLDTNLPLRFDRVWQQLHARYHWERFRVVEGLVDDSPAPAQELPSLGDSDATPGALSVQDGPTLSTRVDLSTWSGPAHLYEHPALRGAAIDHAWMEKKAIGWFHVRALRAACLHPTRVIATASSASAGIERLKESFVTRLLIVLESLFSKAC